MRSIFLTFFFVATVPGRSSVPVDFRTPIHYHSDGRLVAEIVAITSVERVVSRMFLTTNDDSLLAANGEGLVTMIFQSADPYASGYSIMYPEMQLYAFSNSSYLGIGPGSVLTQTTLSVSVIKNAERGGGAELIFGSSFANFNSSCVNDSILSLNYTNLDRVGSVVRLSGEIVGDYDMRIQTNHDFRAGVPAVVFDRLVALVIASGATRIEPARFGTAEFLNCTESVHQSLPDLEFVFGDKGVSLLPGDYLDVDNVTRRCRMRVASLYMPNASIWINPLMLVGMNVRFNSDHMIELCDSING